MHNEQLTIKNLQDSVDFLENCNTLDYYFLMHILIRKNLMFVVLNKHYPYSLKYTLI